MATSTWLDIRVEDAQHYQATLSFRIKDLAFAAAQTIPSAAKIDAVINAIFSSAGTPSDAIVLHYAVRLQEDAPTASGGAGGAAISTTGRVRNALTAIPGNWLFHINGLLKDQVVFDPTNPNSITTTGAMWDAIRAALADAAIAVGDPDALAYSATPEDDIAQVATLFDGRRAPMRPR